MNHDLKHLEKRINELEDEVSMLQRQLDFIKASLINKMPNMENNNEDQ